MKNKDKAKIQDINFKFNHNSGNTTDKNAKVYVGVEKYGQSFLSIDIKMNTIEEAIAILQEIADNNIDALIKRIKMQ